MAGHPPGRGVVPAGPHAPRRSPALGPANRFVSEPYTKLMCSFPTIDLAAAVLVTSEALADRIGVSSLESTPGASSAATRAGPSVDLAGDAPVGRVATIAERLLAGHRRRRRRDRRVRPLLLLPGRGAARHDGVRCSIPSPTRGRSTRTGGLPYFGGPGASVLAARHRLHRRGGAGRAGLDQRRGRGRRFVQRLRRRAAVGRRAPHAWRVGRVPRHHRGHGRPIGRLRRGCRRERPWSRPPRSSTSATPDP